MSVDHWAKVPLGDVCEINPRPPRDGRPADATVVTFVPMAAVDETSASIVAAENRPYSAVKKGFTPFRDNDVLFAKITPCMENGKIALARDLANGLGFGSTEFHVLRASSRVLPEWLRYFVLRPTYRAQAKRRMTGAVGQQRVPAEFLAASLVRLPPVPEQRRIVDLLSRAENIVQMQREAEARAKEIIPALFLDMFGDPARNERAWERRLLGEIVRSIDSGKSPKCEGRARESSEWGVLKLGAVTWGRYNESECKVLPSSIQPFVASEVRAGDLLLSRKNTFELVGASAYVWDTAGRMLLPDLIFRLCIADADVVNPIYLWALLSTNAKRNQLRGMASGAAASMPNISKGRLAMLPLELPPIGAQRTFADRMRQAHELEGQQARATMHSHQAFQSLLAGVFGD